MNTAKTALIVLIAIVSIRFDAAGQTYSLSYDKAFGGSSRDWNGKVVTGPGNTVFIIGDSQSDASGNKTLNVCNTPAPNADIWLIKADTAGNILWQKGYGGSEDERLPQLILLNNPSREMLMVCQSASGISCNKTEPNRDTIPLISTDYWVCLLDSSGNIIWDRTLGGDNYDDYVQAARLTTGEFIIAGESNSPVSGDKTQPNYSISNDIWVVALSASGLPLWDKVYGGTGAEFLTGLIALPGGEFLITGSTSSDQSGDVSEPTRGGFDFWMLKADQSGNKIWDKRFGGSGEDKALSVCQSGQNYLLCGYTSSPVSGEVSQAPKGNVDTWVVKADDTGNLIWDGRYGGTNNTFGTYIISAPQQGYWLAGFTNSAAVGDITQPGYGGSDLWTARIDELGVKYWDKRFGGLNDEYSPSLSLLSDSSIIMLGYADTGLSAVKTDYGYGWWDLWMVKFKYQEIFTGIGQQAATSDLLVYPNPASEGIFVTTPEGTAKGSVIRICDLQGKPVVIQTIENPASIYLDLAHLASGLYFLELTTNGSMIRTILVEVQH